MPSSSFVDLSSSIVHSVFDYLWADELIQVFDHLNIRLDGVLRSYNRYHLNFRSISKRRFDTICSILRADQIESLILSDEASTAGQVDLFFSLFHLDDFVRLRHLSLPFCSLIDYRRILDHSLELRSLEVSLSISNCSAFDFIADQQRAKPVNLRWLKLTLRSFGKTMTIVEKRSSLICLGRVISRLLLESLFKRMTKLRRLELAVESGGNRTLLEAKEWKRFFADRLMRWNFRFCLLESEREKIDDRSIISQFQSSFGHVVPRLAFDREHLTFFTFSRSQSRPPVRWSELRKRSSVIDLSQLEIDCQCSLVHLRSLKGIRVLHLSHPSSLLTDFSTTFPDVERLVAQLATIDQIARLIDQFPYLTSASFHLSEQFDDRLHRRQWLIAHSSFLARNTNFTCQINSQPTVSIHLWINNPRDHPVKSSSIEQHRSVPSRHCVLS